MGSMSVGAAQFKRELMRSKSESPWDAATIDAVSRAVGFRGRRCFWTPAVTVLTFLRQILSGNCSCRAAVAMTVSQSAAADADRGDTRDNDGDPDEAHAGDVSGDPSAYAQARARLPLAWFAELHRRVADGLRRVVDEAGLLDEAGSRGAAGPCDLTGARDGRTAGRGRRGDSLAGPFRRGALPAGRLRRGDSPADRPRVGAGRWCGRRVYVVDGSTVSMPDTPSLQRAFPQPGRQRAGCGFPSARLTAIFCWASGALLDLAVDSLRVAELPLLRRMLKHFRPGDVLVADRGFHSYADVAVWRRGGLDAVLRLNEAARPELRTIRRMGRDQQIAAWLRPKHRPRRLTPSQWADLPESLVVRLLRVRVTTPGFRTRRLEIVTTLLDAKAFPAHQIVRLYRDRWLAELNLRSLKTTLGMDVLRCKSPDMVRKELFMYAVTYNLIRTLMWRAAQAFGREPRRLSFAGAQQRIAAMLPFLAPAVPAARDPASADAIRRQHRLTARLLALIAADHPPHRPNRVEPRLVKRRPKSYPRLTVPRHAARRWVA